MHHLPRPVPPAAPTANHTGVVPRWKAGLATGAAYIAGACGLGVLAVVVLVGVGVAAMVLEADRRRRPPALPARRPAPLGERIRLVQEGDHR